jgi:hypothetical protein
MIVNCLYQTTTKGGPSYEKNLFIHRTRFHLRRSRINLGHIKNGRPEQGGKSSILPADTGLDKGPAGI